MDTQKIIVVSIALLAILASLVMLAIFSGFQGLLTNEATLNANIWGVLGIFAIIIIGGSFLINTGEKMLRNTVR